MRPEIIDQVADRINFLYQHNDNNRVQVIVDGMPLFVLTAPNTKMEAKGAALLADNLESTQAMCRMLVRHLAFANTLPPDRLPLRVPLVFCGKSMRAHPHHVPGSFDFVKKVTDAGVVVIPCGNDDNGNLIVDPPVTQTPTILPVPAVVPGGTSGAGTRAGTDPNAALMQGALQVMQLMTQVHVQSDQRNASMTQQQAKLQAAALQSQAQQLENLTNHLGNLGCEVGRAVASHPTQHSHTIQAALSHPNAVAGQSTDPRVLGSLTRVIRVGMSVPNFDCGPCAQAFQPQPNDKNTRRIDEATHQILQRALPVSVKVRHDAAHTSGVALPVGDCLDGFLFVIETEVRKQHQVVRKHFWHPSFRTGQWVRHQQWFHASTVSYTHLTLPTNREV